MKRLIKVGVFITLLALLFTSCNKQGSTSQNNNRTNHYIPVAEVKEVNEGLQWPEGRVLPKFAKPADTLDQIKAGYFTNDEKPMIAVLQGLVNAKKPRIILWGLNPGEGGKTWPTAMNLKVQDYTRDQKYDFIKKYAGEVTGVVLFDPKLSKDYYNLATTVAGIKKALPLTQASYDKFKENGIDLPVVEDLTKLTYTTPVEIYNYLYEKYWPQCTKRLIVSLSPRDHLYYTRDMAAATGAAVVWLDNQKPDEKAVMTKFFKDMKPGKSLAIGWYTEERSGIGTGAENGISTVPADYFENSTVYAGTPSYINIPSVPNKPELENKVYIALYLSDGDNIQYDEHAMKNLWENKDRGSVPINWTISPSLVDFAPGMLNYYYKTASPNDFFASGPSGLGYAQIVDRLSGGIVNFKSKENMDAYTTLSQVYEQRAGLRVITIWDEVQQMHAESYAQNGRYLYGNTYEDWVGSYEKNTVQKTYIIQNKMAFIPNNPCYTSKIDEMYNAWSNIIKSWKGDKPLFFSAQGNSWFMTPANIKTLSDRLNELAPGKVQILRGDHFFSLFNEANGLPLNLAISGKLKVEASDSSKDPALVVDGTPAGEIWSSSSADKWLKFDFGGEYEITRYVVRHAGDNGLDKSLNTKDFTFETSMDGKNWTKADSYKGNTENVTDIDIDPVKAKFARLVINNPGADGTARIAEVEIFAKVVK